MTFLIFFAVFLIIRSGFRSTGNGSFLASLILFVGVMCAYSGMWFYGAVLIGLSFLAAGGPAKNRRRQDPYGPYNQPY